MGLTRAQMRAIYSQVNGEGFNNLDLGHAPLKSQVLDFRGTYDSTEAFEQLRAAVGSMRDLVGVRDEEEPTSEANARALPQPGTKGRMRVTNFFLRRNATMLSVKKAREFFPTTAALSDTRALKQAEEYQKQLAQAWWEDKDGATDYCTGMLLGHLENGAHVALVAPYKPKVRIMLDGVRRDGEGLWKRVLEGAMAKAAWFAKADQEDIEFKHQWLFKSQTFFERPVLVLDAHVPGMRHAQWLIMNLLKMEKLQKGFIQLRVPQELGSKRWKEMTVNMTVQETQFRSALQSCEAKDLFKRVFNQRSEEILQTEAFHHLTGDIPTHDKKGVAPYQFVEFPVKNVRVTGLRCSFTVAEFDIRGGFGALKAIPLSRKDVEAMNTPIACWDIETHCSANYGKNTARCKPGVPEDFGWEGGEELKARIDEVRKPQIEEMKRMGLLDREEEEQEEVLEAEDVVEDEGEGEGDGGGGGGEDVMGGSDAVVGDPPDANAPGDRIFMLGMNLGWTSNVSDNLQLRYLAHGGLGDGDEERAAAACKLHSSFLRIIFTLQECAPVRGACVVICDSEAQLLDLARDVFVVLYQTHINPTWNGWRYDQPWCQTRAGVVGENRWRFQREWSDMAWGDRIIERKMESSAVGKNDPNHTNNITQLQADWLHYDKNIRAGPKRDSYRLGEVAKAEKLLARNVNIVDEGGEEVKDLKKKEKRLGEVGMDGKLDVEYWMLDVVSNWEDGEPDPMMVGAAATYCLMDCLLCMLYCKQMAAGIHLMGMSQIMYTHSTTGMVLQQQKVRNNLMRTKQADDRIMENMYSTKHSAPHKGCYKGGTVLNPFPALYSLIVLMMDFASLYPSLIRMRNLCYSTFLSTSKQINNALRKGYPVFQVVGSMQLWSFLQNLPRWWPVARLGEAVQRLRHLVMAVFVTELYVVVKTSEWDRKMVYTRRNHLTHKYDLDEWVVAGLTQEEAEKRANAVLGRRRKSKKRPYLLWAELKRVKGVSAKKMIWKAGYGWNVDCNGLEYVQLDDWSTYCKHWTDPIMRLEYLLKRVASPDAVVVADDPMGSAGRTTGAPHGIHLPSDPGLTITHTNPTASDGIPQTYRNDNSQISLLQLDGIPLCGSFGGCAPLATHRALTGEEQKRLAEAVRDGVCCDEALEVRVPVHKVKWAEKDTEHMDPEMRERMRHFAAGGEAPSGLVAWMLGTKRKADGSGSGGGSPKKKAKNDELKHLPCVTDLGTHLLARALLSTMGPSHHPDLAANGRWQVWDHRSHGIMKDRKTPQRPGQKALDGSWFAAKSQNRVEKLLRSNIACPHDFDNHSKSPPEGSHVIVAGDYEEHPDIKLHDKKGKLQLNVGVPLPALCVTRGLEGCLPKSERELLAHRNAEKVEMAAARKRGDEAGVRRHNSNQLCDKILMNSMYGFLGAVFSFYGCVAVADSICAVGGQCLRVVAWTVENEFRRFIARVVYGDTDSVMLTLEGLADDPMRLMRVAYIIEQVLTALSNFPMNMEFEAAYGRFLAQLSKIYGGLKMESPGSGPLCIEDMGMRAVALEAGKTTYWSPLEKKEQKVYSICIKGAKPVRRDATKFTRDIITTVYETLLRTGDLKLTLNQLQMYLRLLSEDKFTLKNTALVGSGLLKDEKDFEEACGDGRLVVTDGTSDLDMFVLSKGVRPDSAYNHSQAPNEALIALWKQEKRRSGSGAMSRIGLFVTKTVDLSSFDPPPGRPGAEGFARPKDLWKMKTRAKERQRGSKSLRSIPGLNYKEWNKPSLTISELTMYEEKGQHQPNFRYYLWNELYNVVRNILMCAEHIVRDMFLEADRAIQSYAASKGEKPYRFIKDGKPARPPPESGFVNTAPLDLTGEGVKFCPMRWSVLQNVTNDMITVRRIEVPLEFDDSGNARDTRFDQS